MSSDFKIKWSACFRFLISGTVNNKMMDLQGQGYRLSFVSPAAKHKPSSLRHCTIFTSNKLELLWHSQNRTAIHPFISCMWCMCVCVWSTRPLARPCHLVSPICLKTVSAPPRPPTPRRASGDTTGGSGGRRGLLRAGSDHGSAAGRPQKAKHSCIWIIYCTNSHICISGHFQVTGAQWFTSLCQNVLVLVWNRMDIKLVWIQVPSWIFKAAV